ncbi:hypothetical protein [Saccharomonospora glauca]|jgi:hypothetical protein|uniref:Uncharacterized protein n=1 Tax=Saccharomonospora glauca K62 TaxID=928724 RepID=I1CYN8_9PSEU|nr:hypothetical protein [Saccharomonospora glauca]EIE97812.1 hypothetical protein SacglDRAFT_00874 [Saccharomonospora glauca K62]
MTREVMKRRPGARQLVVRVLAGAFGAVVLGVLARELPALVRYAKIRSM